MLEIFLNVIMPVVLVALVAAAFQRWRKTPVAPLNQITLYLLTPALIFTSLIEQQLPAATSVRAIAGMLTATGLVLVAGILINVVMRHDRPMQSAFLLATGFPNSGNMALPILLLAFGEPGLAIGIVVFVTQAITGQSLGILVAARSQMSGMAALKQVFKLPAVYAIIAALLVRLLGINLPTMVSQPVKLLSEASIPVMLVVLGFQLGAGVKFDRLPSLTAALVLRLLISAPIAYGATLAFGLTGLAQGVIVIVSAMPVAVFTTILATEFKAEPKFVTNVVIASTLLSIFSLTVVITVVKRLVA